MIRGIILVLFTTIILAPMVSAVIIESTEANQVEYKNGDLIIIDLETNAEGLEVNADFSRVDSAFNQGSVRVDPDGERYTIIYPITFKNTRGDATYNSIITVFDPATSTTSQVTYGINLANTGQREQQSQKITIEIQNGTSPTNIDIVDGQIQVCTTEGCEILTEAQYDASRTILVESGTVKLGDMTYNQLKEEIAAEINTEIRAEIRDYVVEISEVKRLIDQGIFEINEIVAEQQNMTNATLNRTEQLIAQGNRNNIISILLVLIIISLAGYTLFLRTETTWMSR